jgi:hypothetical protein
MLSLFILWPLIALVSGSIGLSILRSFKTWDAFDDDFDLLFVSIWIGLGVAAAISVGFGLIGPVGWSAAVAVVGLSAALYPAWRRFRFHSLGWSRPLAWSTAVIFLALVWHAASVPVDAYDTGLYHQPFVSWISRFGFVQGMAWLHVRFGHFSSWFVLGSVFNHGWFEGRASAILGGFAVLLVLIHWLSKVDRLVASGMRPQDWLLFVGYPALLGACWLWHYEVSLGADFISWMSGILLIWTAAVAVFRKLEGRALLLPLLVATIGMTFKLSAAPLVVMALVFPFVVSAPRPTLRESLAISAICMTPLMLLLTANLVVSGCPVFPNSFACSGADWAVTKSLADATALDIRDFARWGVVPPPSSSQTAWLKSWIHPGLKLGLLALALCGAAVVAWQWITRPSRFEVWILLSGFLGLAFLFTQAPNPRFGLAYFILFPAVAFMRFPKTPISPSRVGPRAVFAGALTIAALILVTDFRSRSVSFNGLLPRPIASKDGDPIHLFNQTRNVWTTLQTVPVQTGSLRFNTPASGDQCWGEPPPCAPLPLLDSHFELRKPEDGIAAGFRRK